MPSSESPSESSGSRPKAVGVTPLVSADQEPTVISTRSPMEVAATAPAPERLGPGTRFGNFELLECVGGGGMGRVFRARDMALARTVAIKLLSREQAADGEVLLRFRNEAQTAARLNHENLVHVYHSGDEDGIPYIVFEFIEGMNIRTLVERKGVLPLAEAISYTFQVAEALSHAVAQNVVHRDIKPSNILITSRGQAKLIDLGLARLQKLSEGEGDLTASGVTLGTFDYISPEQARDPRTADVRSDIYSLGCTLFFMLAGRPPFAEGTVLQKLLQHQAEEPPDVRHFRPELPLATSRLLRRMMAKDPRRRFQTPHQLIEALVVLAEELGLHPAGPGERSWVSDPQVRISLLERHLPWIAPAAVLGIAVLAMHFLWSPPPASTDLDAYRMRIEESSSVPPEPSLALQGSRTLAQSEGKPRSDAAAPSRTEAQGASQGPETDTPTKKPPAANTATDPPGEPKTSASPQGDGVAGAAGSSATAQPSGATPPGQEIRPDLALPASSSKPSANAASVSEAAGNSQAGGEKSRSASTPVTSGTGVAPPGARAEPTVGVLIVGPVEPGANRFATLSAACAAARTGDVVELRFNGPRQEMPLRLRNLKLTIRAGEGYRPTVVFRPADMDASMRFQAMLSLSGSQLTLINVDLILEVPHEATSDQWSLLESRPAESIRLEKCSLTIQNTSGPRSAYHPDVAFFRVRAAPGSGGVISRDSAVAPQGVTIALVDCTLRGEAVALCAHDLWPIQFSWENGLLVTTERLLVAEGGDRATQPGETVQIGLQHVTAVVPLGLCRFVQRTSGSRLLTTQIDCRNSILVGSPSASLIEHVGAPSVEAARQSFAWNGERNFYEDFGSLWSIRLGGAASSSSETMSFDAWREYWTAQRENAPSWRQVQWKQLPDKDRPIPARVPGDYALSTSATPTNAARGAAGDGRDAGCLADRLPPMAQPSQPKPAPAKAPATDSAAPASRQ